MNTISFTYNPFGYVNSFKNVLHHVRNCYLNEDIFVYTDDGIDNIDTISSIGLNYKCNVIHRENSVKYINRFDDLNTNYPKIIEWINRITYTCKNTNSKWIMLLEDDVVIRKQILYWPSSDCGKNRHDAGFLGGGSIFRREKFLESIQLIDLESIIKNNHVCSWAGDVLLRFIFQTTNATHEKWVELAEPNYWDDTDYSVFHGYKDLHHLG